jgi:hypothetical protein
VLLLAGVLGFWAWEATHPPVAPDGAVASREARASAHRLGHDNDDD